MITQEPIDIKPANKKEFMSMLSHIYNQNTNMIMQMALLQRSFESLEKSNSEVKKEFKELEKQLIAQALKLASLDGIVSWFWSYGKNIIYYATIIGSIILGVTEFKKWFGH